MGAIGTYARAADTSGRITSHTSETGTRTLTWDTSSRLTTVAETGQPNRTYGYDNLNRLTSATESTTRAFSYDLTGNRTSETVNGTPYTYNVDASSNRLTSSANDAHSRSYSYDAAGNTTSDGTRTFTYNDAGHNWPLPRARVAPRSTATTDLASESQRSPRQVFATTHTPRMVYRCWVNMAPRAPLRL
jgi:YD repeat-containing protein